ncbi:MAG: DUF4097 family beta strand repeat protein [Clostridia bacterium]|nr:DUF4097 family beta strand repeat protein [Clostridia bacterium]
MTLFQKTVKYCAMAFAIFLIVSIFSGILGAIGLLDGFFGANGVLEESKTYSASSEIKELEIEIAAAKLVLKTSDAFAVESNLKNLSVKENGDKLTVKEKKRFGGVLNDASVTIFIPQDTVFDSLSIKTGAGRLTADTLSARRLKLELGAGEVAIEKLEALSSAEIEGGAGKITVSDGKLKDLDLAMGVGRLDLCVALLGESELELGVGESSLTLLGKKEDYTVDIEKGLGSITFDGETLSTQGKQGNGPARVDIEGGVGAIRLDFKEK